MKLIKKYRLIWNDKKEIINDPYMDYIGTTTIVGDGMNYFESDNMNDIENKILKNGLIQIENDQQK